MAITKIFFSLLLASVARATYYPVQQCIKYTQEAGLTQRQDVTQYSDHHNLNKVPEDQFDTLKIKKLKVCGSLGWLGVTGILIQLHLEEDMENNFINETYIPIKWEQFGDTDGFCEELDLNDEHYIYLVEITSNNDHITALRFTSTSGHSVEIGNGDMLYQDDVRKIINFSDAN